MLQRRRSIKLFPPCPKTDTFVKVTKEKWSCYILYRLSGIWIVQWMSYWRLILYRLGASQVYITKVLILVDNSFCVAAMSFCALELQFCCNLLVPLLAKKRKWRFWVHPILQAWDIQERILEPKLYHYQYWTYFWMSVGQFEDLSSVIAFHLSFSEVNVALIWAGSTWPSEAQAEHRQT